MLKKCSTVIGGAAVLAAFLNCNSAQNTTRPSPSGGGVNGGGCPVVGLTSNRETINLAQDSGGASGGGYDPNLLLFTAQILFNTDSSADKVSRGGEPTPEPKTFKYARSALVAFYREESSADPVYKARIWTTKELNIYSGANYQIAIYDYKTAKYSTTIPVNLDSLTQMYQINKKLKANNISNRAAVLANLFYYTNDEILNKSLDYAGQFAAQNDPLCKTVDSAGNNYCGNFAQTQVITGTVDFVRNGGQRDQLALFLDENIKARSNAIAGMRIDSSGLVNNAQLIAKLNVYLEELQLQHGFTKYFDLDELSNALLYQDLTFTFDSSCKKPRVLPEIVADLDAAAASGSINVTACVRKNEGDNIKLFGLAENSEPVDLGAISLSGYSASSSLKDRFKFFINQITSRTIKMMADSYAVLYQDAKTNTLAKLLSHSNLFKPAPTTKPTAEAAFADIEPLFANAKMTILYQDASKPYYNLSNARWLDATDSSLPPKLIYSYNFTGNNNFNMCLQAGSMLSLNGLVPLQTLSIGTSACDEQGGAIQANIPDVDDIPEVEYNDGNQAPPKEEAGQGC